MGWSLGFLGGRLASLHRVSRELKVSRTWSWRFPLSSVIRDWRNVGGVMWRFCSQDKELDQLFIDSVVCSGERVDSNSQLVLVRVLTWTLDQCLVSVFCDDRHLLQWRHRKTFTDERWWSLSVWRSWECRSLRCLVRDLSSSQP